MRMGYFLSCEEYSPAELVEQARLAEEAGFQALWVSDHYHPWVDAQGESPFVWSVIGALSQACRLPVTTAVTCPTIRIHPAVVAQAAATSAVMLEGRFVLGVGSGEALNEHVLGGRWPGADERLEMLEEAVDVMRQLWAGDFVSHRGRHYTVEQARVYTRPESPPPVYVSGFGPKAIDLAARIGDGYINTQPDADMVRQFREGGGADKPAAAGFKACYAPTEEEAVRIAYQLWPNACPVSCPRCCRPRATSSRPARWSPRSRWVARSPAARTRSGSSRASSSTVRRASTSSTWPTWVRTTASSSTCIAGRSFPSWEASLLR
ncbi:MAG TPA: TIGR03557 family F420-dependent LLM class oxidoreductase [Micromonosporaceae bacterium]|nr:TIGR03557 family F420-dependent LLM class oxidoreductase [Micromonosporaceae bacterium]